MFAWLDSLGLDPECLSLKYFTKALKHAQLVACILRRMYAGYALLGQLDVLVRVSEARFPWVSPVASSDPALSFKVAGVPGEVVSARM